MFADLAPTKFPILAHATKLPSDRPTDPRKYNNSTSVWESIVLQWSIIRISLRICERTQKFDDVTDQYSNIDTTNRGNRRKDESVSYSVKPACRLRQHTLPSLLVLDHSTMSWEPKAKKIQFAVHYR